MAPHFFKVVLFPAKEGLKIPIKFVRKYGGELQKTVMLKVPKGASWKVELDHSEGRTWLKKGWPEFAEFYSIKQCYFLLFRYNGNSQFHVIIFDHSTTEIDYPVELIKEEEADDISIEILNGDFPVGNSRTKEQRKGLTPYERAKAFRSEKPFFILKVQPSYVSSRFNMSLPIAFVEKHLSWEGNDCELAFRVGEKQKASSSSSSSWAVMFRRYSTARIATSLGCGWKKFVKDNSLKEGYFCVFELESANVFNVVIYRDS